MWFFDKGFAFRISDRLQTMGELIDELARFGGTSSNEATDLLEQFDILNETIQAKDRGVQVGLLKNKYQKVHARINQTIQAELTKLKARGAKLDFTVVHVANLVSTNRPSLEGGDFLTDPNVHVYSISREHYGSAAVVALAAFGVGMDIHLYATGYTAKPQALHEPHKALTWSKIAVIDQTEPELSNRSLAVVLDGLKSKLAHEIQSLARQGRTQ